MDAGIEGSRTVLRVRYAETDQMGRAHHMVYLAWFELGRTELMRENGVSYADLEASGIRLPVAHAEITYRRGVGYDEVVTIGTSVQDVRSRSVTFAYEARRGDDGPLLAQGSTTLVCTGGDGRPRRIPQDIVGVLQVLRGSTARVDSGGGVS